MPGTATKTTRAANIAIPTTLPITTPDILRRRLLSSRPRCQCWCRLRLDDGIPSTGPGRAVHVVDSRLAKSRSGALTLRDLREGYVQVGEDGGHVVQGLVSLGRADVVESYSF